MRIVFVDNLLFQVSRGAEPQFNMEPHLGLMSLVAIARSEGHEALIEDPKQQFAWGGRPLDAGAVPLVADRILSHRPDVVGFTALACNFIWVSRLAAAVRERAPDVPLLLGGPHASILHVEILRTLPAFDVVVRHEAEYTLPPLLRCLPGGDLRGLRGVTFRAPGGGVIVGEPQGVVEDLDDLPMPAFDCYPLTELGEPAMRIDAGRGCPFACTFCSTATFFGRSYRLKTPARLLAEMDLLRDRHGFTRFKLNHDLFTVDRRKVAAFCTAVKGKGYVWSCSARVDCVDEALLEQMHDSGCRGIYFGIETGSRRMQKVSAKRLDLGLVEPTIAIAERLGIATTTSFIAGFPEEERDDQRDTFDMAGRLHCRPSALNTSQVHLLAPEPGTALIAEHRSRLAHDGHVSTFNVPALDAADDETIKRHPILFASYWYFRGAISRADSIFATSAWVALATWERSILAYFIAAFDGSLFTLIDEAHKIDPARKASDLLAGVIAALEARYGTAHHTVSLARFLAALQAVGRAVAHTADAHGQHVEGERQRLRLAGRARLLRDIHDAPRLLERVRALPAPLLLDEASVGPRTHLVVVGGVGAADDTGGAQARVFHASDETAALIGDFAEPTSYWGYCAALLAGPGGALPGWDDVRTLRDMGVLEPVHAVTRAAAVPSELECATA